MKLGIHLTYSNIFPDQPAVLEDLLKDISSDVVISILSVINAELYYDRGFDSQIKILKTILFRFDKVASLIERQLLLYKVKDKIEDVSIFTPHITTEFLHYELTHFRESNYPDTRPEDDINFFKAYLLMAEKLNVGPLENTESDPFQTRLWPTMLGQLYLQTRINPATEIPKAIALFNFLQFNSQYADYVKRFLLRINKETSWNYIFDLTQLVTGSFEAHKKDPTKLFPFRILATPEYDSLLKQLTVDIDQYKTKYRERSAGYSGLKDKPLFKHRDGAIGVMNYNFLSGKVYDGLIFDLYNLSGLNELPEFKSLAAFKNFIATQFTERFLLRKIVHGIFDHKHDVILFDQGAYQGFPDAYVRRGKNVFLFELKDAWFSVETLEDPTTSNIKAFVDLKYNNDKKGTSQLVKHLHALKANKLEPLRSDRTGIKNRNLVIHPIIIYTDRHFELPGINRYLNQEFEHRMPNELRKEFGAIKSLKFVSLTFLVNQIHQLNKDKTSLPKVFEAYDEFLKKASDKVKKNVTPDNLMSIHETVEHAFNGRFASLGRGESFPEVVAKLFELTKGLPSE